MRTIHSTTRIAMTAAVLLAAAAVAHPHVAKADPLLVENLSRWPVFFALADVDGECPNGMRDHTWIGLEPNHTAAVGIKLDGLVLAAAFAERITEVDAVPPRSHFSEELLS